MPGSGHAAQQATALAVELSDPRDPQAPRGRTCKVWIRQAAWQHILQRHVRRHAEPWDQWLSSPWVEHVRGGQPAVRSEGVGDTTGNSADGRLSAALAQPLLDALRASCARPLVLLYTSRYSGRSELARQVWLLVLPSGATAIVDASRGEPRVCTCYFSKVAAMAEPAERWRAEVKACVRRYAVWHASGLEPPPPDHAVSVAQPGGQWDERSGFQFVSLAGWGFSMDTQRPVWRGRLGSWEAVASPAPAARPFRLKRRWREELSDDEKSARAAAGGEEQ